MDINHIIQPGESLQDIAAYYGVTPDAILDANTANSAGLSMMIDASLVIPLPVQSPPFVEPYVKVKPTYMIRTEDDLLRYMWVKKWNRTDEFNADQARNLFDQYITQAIIDVQFNLTVDQIKKYGVSNSTEAHRLFSNYLSTDVYLSQLNSDQLVQLYNEIYAGAEGKSDWVSEHNMSHEYAAYYTYIQTPAEGQETYFDAYSTYQADLAVTDWYRTQANKIVASGQEDKDIKEFILDSIISLIAKTGKDQEVFSGFEDVDTTNEEFVRQEIVDRLGEDFTMDDLMELARTVSGDYLNSYGLLNVSQEQGDSIFENISPTEQVNANFAQSLLDDSTSYSEARALDELRQIVYDPSWDPNQEAKTLDQLDKAINQIIREIMGVNIGFVQDTFRRYHYEMQRQHNWRVELKIQIDQLEIQMLDEQGTLPSLWWLNEIILGILVEPLDWLFSLRDLLQGDVTAVIGFLPLVPSSLRHVMNAAQGIGRFDEIINFFQKNSDNFNEIVRGVPEEYPSGPGVHTYNGIEFPAEALDANGFIKRDYAIQQGWINDMNAFEESIIKGQYGVNVELPEGYPHRDELGGYILQPVETAALYDPEIGELLKAWQGTTSIKWDKYVKDYYLSTTTRYLASDVIDRAGLIFTHYHPRGLSFSFEDVAFAIRGNLSQMRAFTDKGAYILDLPVEALKNISNEQLEIIIGEIKKQFDPYRLAGMFNETGYDVAWKGIFGQSIDLNKLLGLDISLDFKYLNPS